MKYKLSEPRYSDFFGYEVVDILVKKTFLFFSYWSHHDTIKHTHVSNEVVYLLNNPNELKEILSKINPKPERIVNNRCKKCNKPILLGKYCDVCIGLT